MTSKKRIREQKPMRGEAVVRAVARGINDELTILKLGLKPSMSRDELAAMNAAIDRCAFAAARLLQSTREPRR
jgi:hypothetical protein